MLNGYTCNLMWCDAQFQKSHCCPHKRHHPTNIVWNYIWNYSSKHKGYEHSRQSHIHQLCRGKVMARNQDFLKAWPNDNLKHIQIQPWDNSKATFWRNNVINSLLVQVVFVKCHGKGNRYPQLHSQLPWYCCQLKIKAHPQQHMSITPARRNISLVTMATIGINGSA